MMEFHENKKLFEQLIAVVAQTQGIDRLFVEKDYWVTRSLSQLANSPYSVHMVFKGGASLTKAYQFMKEFKELYAHDQESFDHPKGWNRQPHTASPLLMDFEAVWKQLRSIYEMKIPPLAYVHPIPSEDAASEAFLQIVQILKQS